MRIALCDDNEQDLNYYSDLICTLAKEKNIAIEVVRFETGEQALFHISNNEKPIDILLLDVHMPGINGIETGLKLRQAPFPLSWRNYFCNRLFGLCNPSI